MAKRKKPAKNHKKDLKDKDKEIKPLLERSAVREIIAILLVLLAVFLILAIINVAGIAGVWTLAGFKFLVGTATYLLPLALLLVAWMLFRQDHYEFKINNLLGLVALFICLAGIFHFILAPANFEVMAVGNFGGVIGLGLATIMGPILTRPVAIFILAMLLLISLIVAGNARLKDLFAKFMSLFKRHREEAELEINEPALEINNKLPIKGTIGGNKEVKSAKAEPIMEAIDKDWEYPPLDLLEATSTSADPGNPKQNAATIQKTLEDFAIDVQMSGVEVGPTVSQYTLKPPSGVNLNKITALDRNLALALEAHQIRIEAPIPGKSLVGIEVPNKKAATVRLKDIIASKEVIKNKSKLTYVLGRDVVGDVVTSDLAEMPHILVAGATGSGKSVLINTMLVSWLYRNSPSDLKLILIDPKRVEMPLYHDIPHLLTPVILDTGPAVSALRWAVAEMERRLVLLQNHGKRNIIEYNSQKDIDGMPYIVIVIDEMSQLMVASGKEVEGLVVQIAQMARAVGIHLVLATQRPSVNVITGLIKANVPARVALTTTSQTDSRTIIDSGGAEKLLKRGDMLYLDPEMSKPKRIQGVFLSTEEVKAVTNYLREKRQPQYNDEVLAQETKAAGRGGAGSFDGGGGDDELFSEAVNIVIQRGKASSSDLMRRLRVGYARSARLMDMLEDRGVIGAQDGSRPREVLVSSVTELEGEANESE